MGDLISGFRSEGPQVWSQLSLLQKGTLVAVGLSAIAAILFLSQWAQEPEYSAAFTGLSESDASAIVAELKEQTIPYRLSDGGSTVRVPSDQMYDVRLQLVSQGLPKGGSVGFELFDKTSFGLTDFAQRLNFQRALEGELSRTIGRLSGVEEARVHIVLPQDELFARREKAATASVVLSLEPGMELGSRQVRGVINLVSRSVEGLKPENITVVDGEGITLSGEDDALASGGIRTGVQQDAQRGYERALQGDIQAMLEQALGPRKAVVRVSAAFDWDQHESSSETYSPVGKPIQVRSSREVVERSASPSAETGTASATPSYPFDTRGPAGPVSPDMAESATQSAEATPETPAGSEAAASAAEPKYERREVTTNYEVSKLVERSVKAPGTIKRLSVAVMLDGEVDEGLASTVSKSVTAAAGLDAERGDSVVVTSLQFDRSALAAREQASEEAARHALYAEVAKIALAVVSLLVVALLVRSLIKGLSREVRLASAGAGLIREPRQSAMIPSRAPLSEEEKRPLLAQREVAELARAQPRVVAQIVKSWLDER